jgi:hypothetical protein
MAKGQKTEGRKQKTEKKEKQIEQNAKEKYAKKPAANNP